MNAESMGRSMVDQAERQRVLKVLTAATFLVFAQAFMVAPLIPRLAEIFQVAPETIGIVVPAYLIPYGLMNLVWGPLSDRLGRGKVILGSLGAFVLLTAASASVGSAGDFIAARVLTAVGASAVVPISLALMGDLYEFQERGRPLGWLFGAMAGGMAVGSSAGALLEPAIGWQGLFIGTAGLGGIVLLLLLPSRGLLAGGGARVRRPVGTLIRGYLELLKMARGRRTYGFVLLNAILHSGIYTWLGLYFHRRYGLSEVGIGLALLGYGVPGFVFGPVIGRLADRKGRGRLIPLGLATAALSAIVLAAPAPLLLAAVAVAVLSLGYDLTQPLLAGIVTDLSPNRGQAERLYPVHRLRPGQPGLPGVAAGRPPGCPGDLRGRGATGRRSRLACLQPRDWSRPKERSVGPRGRRLAPRPRSSRRWRGLGRSRSPTAAPWSPCGGGTGEMALSAARFPWAAAT